MLPISVLKDQLQAAEGKIGELRTKGNLNVSDRMLYAG